MDKFSFNCYGLHIIFFLMMILKDHIIIINMHNCILLGILKISFNLISHKFFVFFVKFVDLEKTKYFLTLCENLQLEVTIEMVVGVKLHFNKQEKPSFKYTKPGMYLKIFLSLITDNYRKSQLLLSSVTFVVKIPYNYLKKEINDYF